MDLRTVYRKTGIFKIIMNNTGETSRGISVEEEYFLMVYLCLFHHFRYSCCIFALSLNVETNIIEYSIKVKTNNRLIYK